MIPRLSGSPDTAPLYVAFLREVRRRGFEGDCSTGYGDRLTISTDNSIYQRLPQAVIYPKNVDDIVRISALAAEDRFRELKLTPRGGGTGTNGQSLTDGVSVDLSRHMNGIIEIDVEQRWARVQAGVVKDQLNAALRPHGLFFAPELSTSNRATIGGMISTDASGQGSCLYGKTRDHVLELTSVLLGGQTWRSVPLADEELETTKRRDDRVGAAHALLDSVHRDNRDLIEARFPKLNRCLTGYDLAHLRTKEGLFDLNAILCGSEGTLGFIAEAKLNLLPIPQCSAIVNVRYDTFDAALRDARTLMSLDAASIETVDSLVLGLGRGDVVWSEVGQFFPEDGEGPAQGINLVEFLSDREDDLERQLARVEAALGRDQRKRGSRGYTVARGEKDVKRIWNMRKRAAGLLGNVQGEERPIPFVEDTAVPPESLADYIGEFRGLLNRRGLSYGMFGHVDAGVLHVRPAIDMKDPEQEKLIRDISDEVAELTLKYGGLLWGEHGKGIRSEYGPRFFGPLYPLLQRIKAVFDPHDQLNPGKIATVSGEALLKIDGVPTRGQSDRQISPETHKSFEEAMHCNGNGACFNFDKDDAMCPSWKATRDRRHSPKGRATLIREWTRALSKRGIDIGNVVKAQRASSPSASLPARALNTLGKVLGLPDFSHEVKEAMDGCLACKSCAGECPIKVDVPSFRAKFLELYHGRYFRAPRDHILASIETRLPTLARASPLYNVFVSSALGQFLLKRIGLIGAPRLSGVALEKELTHRGVQTADPQVLQGLTIEQRAKSVVLVQDAFTSYFETEIVLDAVDLIKRLGFTPWVAPFLPNGKPLHVHGFLSKFERTAGRNAIMLRNLASSGVELVGLDPSITLTYRSEYRQALGADAPQVMLLQEWLAKRLRGTTANPSTIRRYWLLPHCTERTNAASATEDWKAAFAACGAELTVLRSGCCGMAGAYGYATENRMTAKTIYRQSWRNHVRNREFRGNLLASGHSCRCQTKMADEIELLHPVRALLDMVVSSHA
ncbi:FAD/FMN-containing dehydrogenase/Fe-S oxidoreductase [Bradyrhizobium sp. USDA 326]|uniref:D-2-hydroxyglutarate dehydrogenase YdiJ n=1 Tax=unclassified Bradyrhizobium TaxID=2631580 RepID=UPI0035111B7B